MGPVTTVAVNRPHDVELPGNDVVSSTTHESAGQGVAGAELAAHVLAMRYGVSRDLAPLMAGLSKLGGTH